MINSQALRDDIIITSDEIHQTALFWQLKKKTKEKTQWVHLQPTQYAEQRIKINNLSPMPPICYFAEVMNHQVEIFRLHQR